MKISIDLNTLTLGELKTFERLGGDMSRPNSFASLTALVYIVAKRDNPSITVEEIEAMTIDEIEFEQEEPGKLDPKATKTSEQE